MSAIPIPILFPIDTY